MKTANLGSLRSGDREADKCAFVVLARSTLVEFVCGFEKAGLLSTDGPLAEEEEFELSGVE